MSTPVQSSIWMPLELPYGMLFSLRASGVHWDQVRSISYYRGAQLPETLKPYLAPVWSWGWHQARKVNAETPVIQHFKAPAWRLRPHQQVAASAMLLAYRSKLPGFVLADDVGVGKTLSAWSFLSANLDAKPWILIVTTASALAHWRNTLTKMAVNYPNILIVNYEQLHHLVTSKAKSSTRRKGRTKRLAKQGSIPHFDFVVFDEAHKGRNPLAARSILMRKLSARATFTLWLSATIGRNPLELSYLSGLLSRLTGTVVDGNTMKAFGNWCIANNLGVRRGAYGAYERLSQADPDQNIAALARAGLERTHDILFKSTPGLPPAALRRLPQDVADWPQMSRQLEPEDVVGESLAVMEKAMADFRAAALIAGKVASKSAAAILVRQLRLRQAFSQARLSATADHVLDLLDNGKQVAVSVAFLASLEGLAARLDAADVPCARIHGGCGKVAREAERCRFQRGEARVVIFTVEEGISLHQGEVGGNDVPRVMLIHDVRWSPIQMTQIEGRCHRNGALAPVRWLFAANTIEANLVETVLAGVISMKTMLGDDPATVDALTRQLESWAASP